MLSNIETALFVLGFVQTLPLIIGMITGGFSILSVLTISHFAYFTLPKMYIEYIGLASLNGPNLSQTCYEFIYCYIAMSASYLTLRGIFKKRYSEASKISRLPISTGTSILFTIGLIGITIVMNDPNIQLSSLASLFSPIQLFLLVLLSTSSIGNSKAYQLIGLSVGSFVAFYVYLMSAFLMPAMVIAAIYFVAGCLEKKPLFLLSSLMLGAFVLVSSQTKSAYRTVSWAQNLSLSERWDTYYRLLAGDQLNEEGVLAAAILQEAPEFTIDTDALIVSKDTDGVGADKLGVLKRLNEDTMEVVLEMTPGQVPFWEGKSYEDLGYVFLPRMFFPNKPVRNIWQKFGHAYGYLDSDDDSTSVLFNYFAEAYMNFGFGWLYSLAGILGLLVGGLELFSLVIWRKPYLITYILVSIPFANFHADLTSLVAYEYYMCVLLVFGRYFIAQKQNSRHSIPFTQKTFAQLNSEKARPAPLYSAK